MDAIGGGVGLEGLRSGWSWGDPARVGYSDSSAAEDGVLQCIELRYAAARVPTRTAGGSKGSPVPGLHLPPMVVGTPSRASLGNVVHVVTAPKWDMPLRGMYAPDMASRILSSSLCSGLEWIGNMVFGSHAWANEPNALNAADDGAVVLV